MTSSNAPGDLKREWSLKKSKTHLNEEQKYETLVLRDKILRANQDRSNKQTQEFVVGQTEDHAPIKGTCPEMCPEKERYERIKQDRVGSFEHNRHMVKDFSRQAADQEVPLPNELRTPSALRTTMNYLLHEILSQVSDVENPSGWYDFVWRRIRSVRKEITQQRLVGPDIATMLEEMCRFHIAAFHMFAEALPNQFDQKLNLENLNDCLASLDRIYAEMATNGQFSENIAEFRAYEMLLRIWTDKLDLVKMTADVSKLPVHIQSRHEIAFARKVISSCNNRLWNEYLSLITAADYVTACLMHLYLPRMQIKVLEYLITSAGGRSKPNITVPVRLFIKMTGLESESDLQKFCDNYNLTYGKPEQMITVPSSILRSRDQKQHQRTRSRQIVEPKIAGRNFAEIVARKRLAEIAVPQIVEIDSFDEQGFYVGPNPFDVREEKGNFQAHARLFSERITDTSRPLVQNKRNVVVPEQRSESTFFRLPPSSPKFPAKTSDYIPSLEPSVPGTETVKTKTSLSPQNLIVESMTSQRQFSQINPGVVPVSPVISGLHESEKKRRRSSIEDAADDSNDGSVDSSAHKLKRMHSESFPSSPANAPRDVPASPVIQPTRSPVKRTASFQGFKRQVSEREKTYPEPTSLKLLHARSICQASALLHRVFNEWRNYAVKIRKPTHFFGHVDPSVEQKKQAVSTMESEQREFLWARFPFRSVIISPHNVGFDICTICILFIAAPSNASELLSRWLRVKFGDPTPRDEIPVRVLTYENEQQMLRIIFVNVDSDPAAASDTLAAAAMEVGAVMVYCDSHSDVIVASNLLNDLRSIRNELPELPVVVFWADPSMSADDLDILGGSSLRDVFVPQPEPTIAFSLAIAEHLRWLITNRARNPLPTCTTVLNLTTKLYCDFLKLCRTVRQELNVELMEKQIVEIWNDLTGKYFKGTEIKPDESCCCDLLLQIIRSPGLSSYLQVDASTLWENVGRYPKVYPLGLLTELGNPDHPEYNVLAVVAEKVLAVTAMVTMSDPVIWQKQGDAPDYALIVTDLLGSFYGDRGAEDSDSGSITRRQTSSSSDSVTEYPELSKSLSVDLEEFKRDSNDLLRWFGDISGILAGLDDL